jgi:hypothetical protein
VLCAALLFAFAGCSSSPAKQSAPTTSTTDPAADGLAGQFIPGGEPKPPTGDPRLIPSLMTPEDLVAATAKITGLTPTWQYAVQRGVTNDTLVCGRSPLSRADTSVKAWASYQAGIMTFIDDEILEFESADQAAAVLKKFEDQIQSCSRFTPATGAHPVNAGQTLLKLPSGLKVDGGGAVRVLFYSKDSGQASQFEYAVVRRGRRLVHVTVGLGMYSPRYAYGPFLTAAVDKAAPLLAQP